MRLVADILVARAPAHPGAGRTALPSSRVHERPPRYEDEGSVRESRGAVTMRDGAWWTASLSAPLGAEAGRGVVVRVHLERRGTGRGDAGDSASMDLIVGADELDAVVALLAGLVSQARRDAVLP